MAYHKENPTKEDRPIYATKNSLAYTKKALSYFMVHSNVQWNDVQRFGNPTKSKQVNSLLRVINKMETSNQGKPSSADRAFEYEEFAEAILSAGYEFHVWTVDDIETARRMRKWGAMSITTNTPREIREHLFG